MFVLLFYNIKLYKLKSEKTDTKLKLILRKKYDTNINFSI
jgi:hypothetical protein